MVVGQQPEDKCPMQYYYLLPKQSSKRQEIADESGCAEEVVRSTRVVGLRWINASIDCRFGVFSGF